MSVCSVSLARWAAHVGYRRLWMDGEVLDVEPCSGGRAETRCTGCRVRFVDADLTSNVVHIDVAGGVADARHVEVPGAVLPGRDVLGVAGPGAGSKLAKAEQLGMTVIEAAGFARLLAGETTDEEEPG